jgi:hypothetical protein
LLWEWTNRGDIPHVRRGRVILYPVEDLKKWLRSQSQGGSMEGGADAVG